MENLLQATKDILEENGKTIEDILWVGSADGYIEIEEFLKCADFEYDDGYGSPQIAQDLVVVGEDWWLERHEYDGSEWWEFKSLPQKPTRLIENAKVGCGMWDSLARLNDIHD